MLGKILPCREAGGVCPLSRILGLSFDSTCLSLLLFYLIFFSFFFFLFLVVYLNYAHFCLLFDAFCAGVTCAVGWPLRIRCPSEPGLFHWVLQTADPFAQEPEFLVTPRPPVVRVELVTRMCFNSCHRVYKPRTPVVRESRTGDEDVFIPVTGYTSLEHQ